MGFPNFQVLLNYANNTQSLSTAINRSKVTSIMPVGYFIQNLIVSFKFFSRVRIRASS